MVGKFLALVAVGAMVSAVPALAENNPPAPKTTADPNAIVCEKIEVIGSRLAVKKVCMTRAEWAERRQQDRDEIDRAQKAGRMKGE